MLIEEKTILTKDINSTEVYENINNFRPDVIIVRGTSIIRDPLININVKYFLNIHGGIVQEDFVTNELIPAIDKSKALA